MRFVNSGSILATIIAIYLALATAYAVKIPKWNAPDEPSHYNYVKSIAQDRRLPILVEGDYDFDYLEKLKSSKFPDSMPVDGVRYESHQPPLYYLLATPIFWLTAPLPLDAQVIILRLLSAIFGGLTILVAYRTTRQVFGSDALVPLAVAAFIASVPQHIAMTAAINNDSLANLLLSLVLLACVSLLDQPAINEPRGSSRSLVPALPHIGNREPIVFGGLLGLALLAKSTSSVVVVLVAGAVLVHEFQSGSINSLRASAIRLAKIYTVALAISSWWFIRNAWVYGNLDILGFKRHDLVVTGQPLTGPLDLFAAKRFVSVSFQSFWAQFGWMGILVDERIYLLLWALCALAGVGLLLFLARVYIRGEALTPNQKWSLGLLALSLFLLAAGVIQYNLTYLQAQGRYFFPAIVAIATFFVLGIREIVSPRHARLVFLLLFLGMFAFDVVALVRFILPTFSS